MVETEPNWWRSYLKMGQIIRQKGQLNEAEIWYRRAVDRKPDSAEANNELGQILFREARTYTVWRDQAVELQYTPRWNWHAAWGQGSE